MHSWTFRTFPAQISQPCFASANKCMMDAFLMKLNFMFIFASRRNHHVHHVSRKHFFNRVVLIPEFTNWKMGKNISLKRAFQCLAERFLAINHFADVFCPDSSFCLTSREPILLLFFRLSSHYFDPPKRKKSSNKQQLTLMNQWPFNHTQHMNRNEEILGANENGQIQRNRKTVEIPIGHSSAWKQRAQNFCQ